MRVEPSSRANYFTKDPVKAIKNDPQGISKPSVSKFAIPNDKETLGSGMSIQDLTIHSSSKQEQALNSSRLRVKQLSQSQTMTSYSRNLLDEKYNKAK